MGLIPVDNPSPLEQSGDSTALVHRVAARQPSEESQPWRGAGIVTFWVMGKFWPWKGPFPKVDWSTVIHGDAQAMLEWKLVVQHHHQQPLARCPPRPVSLV